MVVQARYGTEMTLDEWRDLPEHVHGELVDGVLVEEEMPNWPHELVVRWIVTTLSAWLIPRGGQVFASGGKFAVSREQRRGRIPDASAFFPGNKPLSANDLDTPAAILIEVVSNQPRDRRRDRVAKMNEYAAFGVAHYWLIDPEARTFEIFSLTGTGIYTLTVSTDRGRLESVPGCDALALDLDELWTQLDGLLD